MKTIHTCKANIAARLVLVYLISLMLAMAAMWWLVLAGGTPFTARNLELVNSQGRVQTAFRRGEIMGVRRELCSKRPIVLQFHPGLRDRNGLLMTLDNTAIRTVSGCYVSTYAITIPDLPSGRYSYINTASYQDNLIGRDEAVELPPFELEILP